MFRQSFKTIRILLRHARMDTMLKLLQLGVSAIMTPLWVFFLQKLIDSLSTAAGAKGHDDLSPLFLWGGLLLFSLFFNATGGFFDGLLFIRLQRRLNEGLTPILVEKFKRLDYACFEDSGTQDTISRMSDNPQEHLLNLFLNLTNFLTIFVSLVGTSLLFAQIGWWFTAGFLLLLFPMAWFDFRAMDMMNVMFDKQSTDERRMHDLGSLLSTKSSLSELKVFRATGFIEKKWKNLTHQVLETRLATTYRAQRRFLVGTLLFKAWSFFTVLVLVRAVLERNASIGVFTALVASTGLVMAQAEQLSHTLQNVRSRYLLIGHYEKFLGLPEVRTEVHAENREPSENRESSADMNPSVNRNHYEETDPEKPLPLALAFEQVTFRYPGMEKPVLDDISFTIRPNERIALVGVNGAGKSTLIKLLCGLYAPESGRILLNGRDLDTLDKADRQRAFSVVFQDFCRYELTVRENVAFGNISRIADDAHLQTALRQGMAEGFALDDVLGKLEDGGRDLSGGQWQRLAIARACAADSAFVILDEPTASLDPLAESRMYQSFAEVLKNRGCILISHRLASARMADRILVLDGGHITENGSHEELIAESGLYARMYEAQSAWYRGGGWDEGFAGADSSGADGEPCQEGEGGDAA